MRSAVITLLLLLGFVPSAMAQATIASISPDTLFLDVGNSDSFTVTLSQPADVGGAQVFLVTSSGSASVPGFITIPQGSTSGGFLVDALIAGQDLVTASL